MTDQFQEFFADESGMSELIGYAFAFAIILATIVLVSLSSGPIIDSMQSDEKTVAMEQNFIQLDEDIQRVEQGAEGKIYSGQIPAGQLRQLDETQITFDQDGVNETVAMQPLHYQTQTGAEVVYDGGFVSYSPANSQRDAASIQYRRAGSHTDRMMTLAAMSHPSTTSTHSSTDSSLVTFWIEQTNPQESADTFSFSGPETVNVTVDSEVSGAWEAYLTEHPAVENVTYDSSREVVEGEILLTDLQDRFTVSSQEIHLTFD